MATNASELADSLSQDEIPVKLRCASCNKLVVNAFRLPCCEQNICEACHESLPDSCLVCMHSPLSATDCKPNKALRLTIRAFLKSEEKKRSKEKEKEQAESSTDSPAAPPSATSNTVGPVASVNTPVPTIEAPQEQEATTTAGQEKTDADVALETEAGAGTARSASSSIEITLEAPQDDLAQTLVAQTSASSEQPSQPPSHAGTPMNQSHPTMSQPIQPLQFGQMGNPTGFGFGGMNNMGGMGGMGGMGSMGGFGGMGAMNGMPNAGNFNMQTSMNPMNFAGFPSAMGMQGHGMDFMSMSTGMFPGYNGQGFGFNNMGMGYNSNFGSWGGGPSAIGTNGGFNGNFAGYYPPGGYNQQMHQYNQQQQFPMHANRHNRFNGSGPGYNNNNHGSFRERGRGRFNSHNRFSQGPNNFQPASMSRNWQESQLPETQPQPESAEFAAPEGSQPETGETSQDQQPQIDPASISVVNQVDEQEQAVEPNESTTLPGYDDERSVDNHGTSADLPATNVATEEEDSAPKPIATIDSSRDNMPDINVDSSAMSDSHGLAFNAPRGPAAQFPDYGSRGRGFGRGFGRGMYDSRGRSRGRGMGRFAQYGDPHLDANNEGGFPTPSEPLGQGVEGAPTGPKAMREGAPNARFRGRGVYPNLGRGNRPDQSLPAPSDSAVVDQTGKFASEEEDWQKPRSKSPSQSRNRSFSSHRRRRYSRSPGGRSPDRAADPNDGYGDENKDNAPSDPNNQAIDSTNMDEYASRRRDRSTESHDRHSSRRRDRKHRSSRTSHRSRERPRHKHRHRSRSPIKDDRPRDIPDDDNHPSQSRFRSRHDSTTDRHNRRSRSADAAPAAAPPAQREFKIKDRSKRTELDVQKELVREENPDIDPHTLEREARNRERMLKEQQRREGLAGPRASSGSSRKRSIPANHLDDDDRDFKVSRRHRGPERDLPERFGHAGGRGESKERRAARNESEREAARWA